MDLQLTGAGALVTGSTQGIGHAVARALAREGARVVLNGRSGDRVDDAVARLVREVPGASVTGHVADVGDPAQADRLADAAGEVDVLVHAAGAFDVTPFDRLTDQDWQRHLDVHLMGAVRLSRRLLPGMLARGRGRVVMIGSESGVDVPGDMLHYGVAKAAQLALANGLAKLTRGTGVTVNTVLGGPTWSDGVAAAVRGLASAQGIAEDDLRDAVVAGRPTSLLGRFIEPDEIAALVAYLASPLSSATNGAALRADGGVLTTTT